MYHGEASSIEVNNLNRIKEMTNVYTKCDRYPSKDKFNIDESSL